MPKRHFCRNGLTTSGARRDEIDRVSESDSLQSSEVLVHTLLYPAALTPARKNQARIPPAGVNAPGYNGSAHRNGRITRENAVRPGRGD